MVNIKLIMYVGIVSALFAVVTSVYFTGYSAGKDSANSEYDFIINEAHNDYKRRLNNNIEQYNKQIRSNQTAFESEIKARINDAKLLADEKAIASNTTVEIRERIKYVKSDCVNVGSDAYRLYKQTRDIISDPRITDSDITEGANPVQPEFTNTLLQRPKTNHFNF